MFLSFFSSNSNLLLQIKNRHSALPPIFIILFCKCKKCPLVLRASSKFHKYLLAKEAFKMLAAGAVTKAANCLFLYLTNTLAGKPKLLSNLFKCHFAAADTKE